MAKTEHRTKEEILDVMDIEDTSALRDTISNFEFAKELKNQNFYHSPLPDRIDHTEFQRRQMIGDNVPGLALGDGDYANGIGWKGYEGYEPTRCTKMKVFRPKSSPLQPRRPGEKPDTWINFDQKWRFIRQRKVSPMDLALRWDLTPENPKDEPKPAVHIDGSNGCLAPAVFTLVNTPKGNIIEKKNHLRDGVPDWVPLFYSTNNLGNDKIDFMEKRSARKFTEQQQKLAQDTQRSNSANGLQQNDQIKGNTHANENISTNKVDEKTVKCDKKHPSFATGQQKFFCPRRRIDGSCMTCQMNNISINEPVHPKGNTKDITCTTGLPRKQKGKREDYPEHWRLATVYQHSYKPIKNRKCTLLSTVFK
ncbi:uncharacterized protein LOC123315826 isoform X2 [Coccinella septempunctata]|uniref:uncharacterized protein LOC123315826 isoform X2 n=1 Tax=Coccinella septempunctata TaxID=41139 RepID=UPI001D07B1FC|nr:uncharacterized protein LOC123315826 isoform X2 [Coccinella septempunctata]